MERISLSEGWTLELQGKKFDIDLPHTWNNLDGQDGSNGYSRTRGVYAKVIPKIEGEAYLEVLGANSVAEVSVNGEFLLRHEGGYSAFYVPLAGKCVGDENIVEIAVDNSPDESVYPTMADFTFYGGLYRGVNLVKCPAKHFSPEHGGKGVFAYPVKKEDGWVLEIEFSTVGTYESDMVGFELADKSGAVVKACKAKAGEGRCLLRVDDPVLWDVDDPYLYTLTAAIAGGDSIEVETGFREYYVDADKGFFLNGRHIKIKGVSRHQDRENMGNALTEKEHEEDIRLIKEVGANSVRLAHYQHSDYFYTLCDREGLLVWAEIPVISRYSKKRQANAVSQLTELITQARNHPSIFTWSISNEITIAGENRGVVRSMSELNALAKKLDPSRLTVLASVTMCPTDSDLNSITDLVGYNHYFGWYVGTFTDLDKWLQKWRVKAADKKLCLSEYGAEGIVKYQNGAPVPGDYSESYQALFHENYLERINAHDWLWGSYVWNMFDFGSAARNEGGVRGRNNKGLVTFDRKIKKDSFYLYKAYWSDEKFIHIAGKRYLKRKKGVTEVKVYTNLPEVTLECGDRIETKKGRYVFKFDVALEDGENRIKAFSGDYSDEAVLEGVENEPDEYRLPPGAESFVRNWFASGTDEIDPSRFSTNDRVKDLMANAEVQSLLKKFVGNKLPKGLVALIGPFRVKTLLKLPFIKLDEQMKAMADRYLQTIKK